MGGSDSKFDGSHNVRINNMDGKEIMNVTNGYRFEGSREGGKQYMQNQREATRETMSLAYQGVDQVVQTQLGAPPRYNQLGSK
jgi:hypothetical protein